MAGRGTRPLDRGGRGHGKRIDKIHHAVAVRPHEANARRTCEFDQLLLARMSFPRTGFSKATAIHRGVAHALGGAIGQHIEHAFGGNDDANVIRGFRHILDVRITRKPTDFFQAWIDWINFPCKTCAS